MPRGKFVLNKRTVGMIGMSDRGVVGAVNDAAAEVAARSPGATVDTYKTDRHVAGVTVTAVAQARDGAATRAAQSVASDSAARPFVAGGIKSRAQWRYLALHDQSRFRAAVGSSPRYSSLPERKATT